MKAFIDTPITKERFMFHLKEHQKKDAFLKGTYHEELEEGFKGCAVGCSLHSVELELKHNVSYSDHALYEKYLGVPEWLARLEDTLFEGLPKERSKLWPVEFGEAINVGADLDKIKPAFLIFILESTLVNVQGDKYKRQRDAIENVIKLWQRDDLYSKDWPAARDAAMSAEYAASSAASAAVSSVAYSAARSARSAASAAVSSVAWSTSAAASSASSASSAAYGSFADKLLELMRECE